MFHSSAFVIAGTVVSVAAAGAGAYMSTQAANKAAKATGDAGKALTKDQKKVRDEAMAKLGVATGQLTGSLKNIQAPKWNLARDIKEAGRLTDYNVGQLEEIFPGATTSREIAGQTAIAYQKGEIPQDVRDSIMRSVSELGGAGFSPQQAGQVGGFQAAQGLLSRQLGLQSVQLSQIGNQISQGWQALAGSFIESPLRVGQSRLGYEQAAANLEMQKAAAIYNAQAAEADLGYSSGINIASGSYGTKIDTIGANLAANQAFASGISSTGQALGGGLSSYGIATSAARGAGTIDYKGQDYGSVKGYGGQTYSPAVSQSGGLYYKAQPSSSALRALTGGYG